SRAAPDIALTTFNWKLRWLRLSFITAAFTNASASTSGRAAGPHATFAIVHEFSYSTTWTNPATASSRWAQFITATTSANINTRPHSAPSKFAAPGLGQDIGAADATARIRFAPSQARAPADEVSDSGEEI